MTLNEPSEGKSPGSRSQSVILKQGLNIKYPPFAFTEHGALMAATVLNSPRAVQMSVFVVRAFLRLRRLFLEHTQLAERLTAIERRVSDHDGELKAVIVALRELLEPSDDHPRQKIGFVQDSQ